VRYDAGVDPGQRRARLVSIAFAPLGLWLTLEAVARWQAGGTVRAGLTAAGAVLALVLSVATWRQKRW